jgi:hypothetical protein
MRGLQIACLATSLVLMVVQTAVAGPPIESARRTEGRVESVDVLARTVMVGGETYVVVGPMPDVRSGQWVTVTYLRSNGKLVAWFRPVQLRS